VIKLVKLQYSSDRFHVTVDKEKVTLMEWKEGDTLAWSREGNKLFLEKVKNAEEGEKE
jgi:hypothetical protein